MLGMSKSLACDDDDDDDDDRMRCLRVAPVAAVMILNLAQPLAMPTLGEGLCE